MPSTPTRLAQLPHPHPHAHSQHPSSPPTFTSPFASPRPASTPKHPTNVHPTSFTTSSSSNPMIRSNSASHRSAPYMVALSGWPEPIYVSQPLPSRSRPTTPRQSFSVHEISDSITLPPQPYTQPQPPPKLGNPSRFDLEKSDAPQESILSKACMYNPTGQGICPIPGHPRHFDVDTAPAPTPPLPLLPPSSSFSHNVSMDEDERQDEEEDGPFPTSSTRGTPHPSPPSTSRGFAPPPLSMYPSRATPPTATYQGRGGRWTDIRLGRNVAVLAVAPSWEGTDYTTREAKLENVYGNGNGVASGSGVAGRGVRVSAGGRGPGILVMRAVPEVYPPPGGSVATEVYPRDPDAAVLWTRGSGGDGMEVDLPGR